MNQTQTVGRALDILFLLAEKKETLTVSEISERVPIPESTAYRLIKTLEHYGVVERKGKGEIGLGLRIMDLARTLQHQIDQDLLTISLPIMERLTEKLNESSLLVIRQGSVGVTVQHVEGKQLIGLVTKKGSTHPLERGATGKAILAFEDEKFIHNIVMREEKPKKLKEELEEIRKKGYVKTIGEVEQDTLAVASPIFNGHDKVIGSLSIVGPISRFDEKATTLTIEEVVKAAQAINDAIKE